MYLPVNITISHVFKGGEKDCKHPNGRVYQIVLAYRALQEHISGLKTLCPRFTFWSILNIFEEDFQSYIEINKKGFTGRKKYLV